MPQANEPDNLIDLWQNNANIDDDSRYVMLVVQSKKGNNSHTKRWREFKLPLERDRVEAWSTLKFLKFHEVTTWQLCMQRQKDFTTYKHHQIDYDSM
jgi:hypothetical protein